MSKTTIMYRDRAPDAANSASYKSGAETEFSELPKLSLEAEGRRIASLERNAWILNGSYDILGDDETVSFWSTALSGDDCNLAGEPSITIEFRGEHSTLGITLVSANAPYDFPGKVNIKWYRGGTLQSDMDFYPDSSTYFCRNKVKNFDKLVITFHKTSLPHHRIKLEQIIFGVDRLFDMTEIRSARITNQISEISTELPVSEFDWVLDSDDELGFMFQLKQPIEVKNDDFFIGVYYINEHSRQSRTVYDLRCQDALGVLDGDTFDGGVYTNYSARQLFDDIVGGMFVVEYRNVTDKQLTGVITAGTKREALQQVLFAWGVCAATDGGSVIRVFDLPSEVKEIGTDLTYTGVTIETAAIVTAVKITSHVYAKDANGTVEIKGEKYSDTTDVYTITNPDVTANDKQNVIEIKEATLISPAIVQECAQRIYDYYTMRNTAKGRIVWHGELLGDCVSIPSSWGETTAGNISRMEMILSNTVAASLEIKAEGEY